MQGDRVARPRTRCTDKDIAQMILKKKILIATGTFLLLASLAQFYWVEKYIAPADPDRAKNLRTLIYGGIGGGLAAFVGLIDRKRN